MAEEWSFFKRALKCSVFRSWSLRFVFPMYHRCLFYFFNQATMAEDQEFICTLNVFSLSGYKILVNMEPIQGNPDRREPILRKIASDSFFPNPLSPFRQGPLPLQFSNI